MEPRIEFIHGNALDPIPLPDESVDMVWTSPPYWGLRKYGMKTGEGVEIGAERAVDCMGWATGVPCDDCYVCHLVQVFRSVRRVLKPHGTVWLNLGDCYSSGGRGKYVKASGRDISHPGFTGDLPDRPRMPDWLKPKDQVGAPWRVYFALQQDGWYGRGDVVWAKTNPMTESTKDRPVRAHEFLFQLTKSERYYYDHVAVRQEGKNEYGGGRSPDKHRDHENRRFVNRHKFEGTEGASLRSVWTMSKGLYKGSHFAVASPKLVERCILASTSQKGVCAKCGKPWERIVARERVATRPGLANNLPEESGMVVGNRDRARHITRFVTMGWQPTCECGYEREPARVFDPFGGVGTTVLVADALGRRGICLEASAASLQAARERCLTPWKHRPGKTRKKGADRSESLLDGVGDYEPPPPEPPRSLVTGQAKYLSKKPGDLPGQTTLIPD